MLSKNKIKFINALKQKKYREKYNLYILENDKLLTEILKNNISEIHSLYLTKDWTKFNLDSGKTFPFDIEIISEKELKRISTVQTPQSGLAILKNTAYSYTTEEIEDTLSIVLDNIQDPGNMGTIIRTADWFGIKHIFCSYDSVDCYNPKVIQASMGSILRTKIFYTDLEILFDHFNETNTFKIYGTYLNARNIYNESLSNNGFIVFGNESKGISNKLDKYIRNKISIPSFSADPDRPDSLNVAVAVAIICSEFGKRD